MAEPTPGASSERQRSGQDDPAAARRAVVRFVGAGAMAAAAPVAAMAAAGRPSGPVSALVLGVALALVPLGVGIRYAGSAPGPGAASLLTCATSSALAVLGLRLFPGDHPVAWLPLLGYAVAVAAPCWALAGWVARSSWPS